MRGRPIPRSRDYPTESLRYENILDGAVRVYSDGREVCQNSKDGWLENSKCPIKNCSALCGRAGVSRDLSLTRFGVSCHLLRFLLSTMPDT